MPVYEKLVATPAPATAPPARPSLQQELSGLSPLEAQKRLTGRVRAARTLADFAAVVAAGGRLIDSICLVAILAGLPRALQHHQAAQVSLQAQQALLSQLSLSPSAASSAAETPSSSAASAAAAAAAGSEQLSRLVSEVGELVRVRAREFDSNGLVTVAVGFAKLSSAGVAVPPAVLQTLLAALQPRLPGLAPKPLANLMWALATAGVRPCGSWMSAFYGATERQLGAFSGGDLANTLWGLAKFDLMPEVWLMDALVSASLTALRASHSAADGATLLTVLARYYCAYNYRAPDETLAAVLSAVQPGLAAGSAGDLVALVHSAVCVSHMPSRPWMLDYYAALRDRLAGGGGAAAGAGVGGAAGTGVGTAAGEAGGSGAAAAAGGGSSLSYADYSRLLWSLSRVDCPPPRSWLREFVELSTPKLHALRPRTLAELVWALACWDAAPPPRFLDEFYRASARRVADFKPSQVADTLSALSKLGARAPTPWLAGMLAAFVAALPDARANELVTFLESIADVASGDRAWLAAQQRSLQLIADTAAPKFAMYDCVSHTKLVLALARANHCPGAAWLAAQQASLATCWAPGALEPGAAAGLRQAYQAWDAAGVAAMNEELAAELEGLALP